MFNPSGYREDDKRLMLDKEWHDAHFEENIHRANVLLKVLRERHPTGRTLLDIGCGTGSVVLQSMSLGLEATGVDPNTYAVEYGRNQLSLPLVCDRFKPELFKRKFDIVTCIHVLEHLEHPRSLLQGAVRVLKEDGVLFLSVPFRLPFPLQILYVACPSLKGTPFFDNDVHIIHFSHRGFKLLARDFEVNRSEYIPHAGWDGYVWRF